MILITNHRLIHQGIKMKLKIRDMITVLCLIIVKVPKFSVYPQKVLKLI